MFLSYLITCHNEDDSLDKLLSIIIANKKDTHEIILLDDHSDNENTIQIINKYQNSLKYHKRHLNNHYGEQKNYGIDQCNGKWIFQIDADEYPTIELTKHIDQILESNDGNEVVWVPRINIFHGINDNDIKHWGWNVSKLPQITNEKSITIDSQEYLFLKNNNFIITESKKSSDEINIKYNIPLVNVPDYQSRLFKNLKHIRYERRLHEKVEGFESYTFIPPQPDIALIHEKTIEKQRSTNIGYNTNFTENENRGYSITNELNKK
jgi:glycosyltransferase involved in cell wall biosynthesis